MVVNKIRKNKTITKSNAKLKEGKNRNKTENTEKRTNSTEGAYLPLLPLPVEFGRALVPGPP